jgi:hypothetical protein
MQGIGHDAALRPLVRCNGERRAATLAKPEELGSKPSQPGPNIHRMAVGAALLISVACGAFVAVAVMLTYKLVARMIVE